ncbi:MAG: PEGA domain-containing protein [Candidatus Shapirobacteria bacterium]
MKNKIREAIMIGSVLAAALFLSACGTDRSGVEIISAPIAKVYLNGKEVGMTPYKNNNLKTGVNEIKLDDGAGKSWGREIKLENNVSTVINWDFSDKNQDSGYILSMENNREKGSILVSSIPSGAAVNIEGELKGYTPIKIDNLESGNKNIIIGDSGYKSVDLIVKIVDGYQLIIDSKLKKESVAITVSPTPTVIKTMIKIKETETGWLRVRKSDNNNSEEIDRVKPGEEYEMISEENDWYQIKINDTENGWISTKYAEKISK